MIVVNKNDGDLKTSARRSVRSFRDADTEETRGGRWMDAKSKSMFRIGTNRIE